MSSKEAPSFGGNLVLGAVSVVLLGPVALAGAACVVIGFLALWGIEIGPLRDADVPLVVNLLYGGGSGTFRSFVFFMVGAITAWASWTGIVWYFTGEVPEGPR